MNYVLISIGNVPDYINYTINTILSVDKDAKIILGTDQKTEFKNIEDAGLVRCIAQNFTTQWYKLYDDVEEIHCDSCNNDVYLGKDESRICPNPECVANL